MIPWVIRLHNSLSFLFTAWTFCVSYAFTHVILVLQCGHGTNNLDDQDWQDQSEHATIILVWVSNDDKFCISGDVSDLNGAFNDESHVLYDDSDFNNIFNNDSDFTNIFSNKTCVSDDDLSFKSVFDEEASHPTSRLGFSTNNKAKYGLDVHRKGGVCFIIHNCYQEPVGQHLEGHFAHCSQPSRKVFRPRMHNNTEDISFAQVLSHCKDILA